MTINDPLKKYYGDAAVINEDSQDYRNRVDAERFRSLEKILAEAGLSFDDVIVWATREKDD